MPSLSTALCLSQLLSTVTEKGGNPASYREQTGQSDTLSSFKSASLLLLSDADRRIFLPLASLAKRFLGQDWVTAAGEKERGNKFNEALQSLLRCGV